MIMYADIDESEPKSGIRVNYDPSWAMTLASSVKYRKDVAEFGNRITNLMELYQAYRHHARKEEQERDSAKHGESESAEPPRKAFLRLTPASSSKDDKKNLDIEKPPGNWSDP